MKPYLINAAMFAMVVGTAVALLIVALLVYSEYENAQLAKAREGHELVPVQGELVEGAYGSSEPVYEWRRRKRRDDMDVPTDGAEMEPEPERKRGRGGLRDPNRKRAIDGGRLKAVGAGLWAVGGGLFAFLGLGALGIVVVKVAWNWSPS